MSEFTDGIILNKAKRNIYTIIESQCNGKVLIEVKETNGKHICFCDNMNKKSLELILEVSGTMNKIREEYKRLFKEKYGK